MIVIKARRFFELYYEKPVAGGRSLPNTDHWPLII